jgi:hypothetical protein
MENPLNDAGLSRDRNQGFSEQHVDSCVKNILSHMGNIKSEGGGIRTGDYSVHGEMCC